MIDIIKDVVRKISHPEEGLPVALKFDPVTLENWVDFFDDNIGWINVHLEDTKLLNKINFGEIIPNTSPYLDIYDNKSPLHFITRFIKSEKNVNKRLILNFLSIKKLIKALNITDRKIQFEVQEFFKKINPQTFWLNLKISDQKQIDLLKKHNIGTIVEASEESLLRDMIKNLSSSKVTLKTMDTEEENVDDKTKKLPYILVLNSKTLSKIFTLACKNADEYDEKLIVYEYLSKDDISDLFMKLSL